MRALVEKRLEELFAPPWGEKEIYFFLNKSEYAIDKSAVNNNLVDPMRDFVLRGGKRIRPVLFLLSIELFGGDPKDYVDFAVAIELVHNGTLVLDDIEDRAALRRGKPSCHISFGLDTATNVGMAMHVLPLQLMMGNGHKLSLLQREKVTNIYMEELINVSFGQALDIYWHKNAPNKLSVDEYLEMVRLKTGSLMRMSMRMACALMNRTSDTEHLFTNFAKSLGIAFQIIDDSLDIDPPSHKFGKTYGNDITEGKLSLPVVYTFTSASKADRERLREILNKHTRNKKYIDEAISIIKKHDSVNRARSYAANLVNESWHELKQKWEKRNNLSNLESMTNFFISRDH